MTSITPTTTIKEESLNGIERLTWENVVVILKAAHNVRFISTVAKAQKELEKGTEDETGDSVCVPASFPYILNRFNLPEDPLVKKHAKNFDTKGAHITTYFNVDQYLEHTTPENWTLLETGLQNSTAKLTPEDRQKIADDWTSRFFEFFDNALANTNKNAMVLIKPVLTDAMHRVDTDSAATGRLGKTGGLHSDAAWYSKQIFLVQGDNDPNARKTKAKKCLEALVTMAAHVLTGRG